MIKNIFVNLFCELTCPLTLLYMQSESTRLDSLSAEVIPFLGSWQRSAHWPASPKNRPRFCVIISMEWSCPQCWIQGDEQRRIRTLTPPVFRRSFFLVWSISFDLFLCITQFFGIQITNSRGNRVWWSNFSCVKRWKRDWKIEDIARELCNDERPFDRTSYWKESSCRC